MKTKIALAGVVALLGVATFSTSTYATSWGGNVYTSDSKRGGAARWIENGDIVEICDVSADTYGVYAALYRTRGGELLMEGMVTAGNGTCTTVSKNVPENVDLELQVWLEKSAGKYLYYPSAVTPVRYNTGG